MLPCLLHPWVTEDLRSGAQQPRAERCIRPNEPAREERSGSHQSRLQYFFLTQALQMFPPSWEPGQEQTGCFSPEGELLLIFRPTCPLACLGGILRGAARHSPSLAFPWLVCRPLTLKHAVAPKASRTRAVPLLTLASFSTHIPQWVSAQPLFYSGILVIGNGTSAQLPLQTVLIDPLCISCKDRESSFGVILPGAQQ